MGVCSRGPYFRKTPTSGRDDGGIVEAVLARLLSQLLRLAHAHGLGRGAHMRRASEAPMTRLDKAESSKANPKA